MTDASHATGAESQAAQRPSSRALARAWRGAAVFVVVVVLLAAAVSLGAPGLIRQQVETRGSQALGRAVSVQRVELSLLQLTLTLHGLSVAAAADSPSSAPQLTIARLFVDVDARSLLRLAPVLSALRIESPALRLARTAAGRWDIDDILQRLAARPAAPPDAEPARFALFNLELTDGTLRLDDRPVQRQHEVRALQVAIPFLSNLDDDVKVQVQPRLAFGFDGAAVDLRGQTLPFAPDHASELALTLDKLSLERFWAYLPAELPLAPRGGTLSTQLALRFAQAPKQAPQVRLSGEVKLDTMALHRPGEAEPVLDWRRLAVHLNDVQPLQRRVALGAVKLDGARLDLQRDAAGQLKLLPASTGAAIEAKPAPAERSRAAAPAAAATPTPDWQLSVERAEVTDALLRWRDATLPGADARREWQLRELNAAAEGIAWPSDQAIPVTLAAVAWSGDQAVGRLGASGRAGSRDAAIQFDVEGLRLGAFAPYVRSVLKPALEGTVGLKAKLDWAAAPQPRLAVELSQARAERIELREGGPKSRERDLGIAALQTDAVVLDLQQHKVRLAALRLERPELHLHRRADGRLNVQQWLVSAEDPPAKADAGSARAWQIEAGELRLERAQVALVDEAVRPGGEPHRVAARDLRLALRQFRWPATAAPMPLQASTSIVAGEQPAGRIELRGQAGMAPPALRADVSIERLAAAAFEPYAATALPVRIERAELGWRGEVEVAQQDAGLSLRARGEALVADLDLRARPRVAGLAASDAQLLAWQSLKLAPLAVAMAPGSKPRIEIDEVTLADFYARLAVTEQGRFNLSDIQPAPAAPAPGATAAAVSASAPQLRAEAPTAPAASTSAPASAPASASPSAGLPVDLLVARTRLLRGRVDFSDRFVRPNYSAALSELEGSIGRIASGTRQMAPVELRGRVAGTGRLDIRGALNPTAAPLALDIQARATDLELAPLSPYSGKYAGYAIERGKLSVDVAYKVDADGRLEANNQIVLEQLTFGEKVDSPDATKLPVRFALALLADRNGVIDLNLPVSGSINDPQFSVFGIVLKLIGNLLVKALTAPFSLLFGAGGGGEEASLLAFEPGSARLATSAAPALDRVAKALADRPALKLTVAGSADVSEGDALRQELLRRALLDELRRDRARAGAPADAAVALPAPDSPAWAALVRQLYGRTALPDKPRNLLGMAKDVPLTQMESMLRAAQPVPADVWRELALQRGLAVRDALIARGLASERLFLGAPKPREAADAGWTPRAVLALGGS